MFLFQDVFESEKQCGCCDQIAIKKIVARNSERNKTIFLCAACLEKLEARHGNSINSGGQKEHERV